MSIGHIGLTVSDLDAAVDWYERILGWSLLLGPIEVTTEQERVAAQLRDVFRAPCVSFRQAHMLAGDTAVEIFQFIAPRRTEGLAAVDYTRPGVFHICVVAPAIEGQVARIVASGGEQRSAIRPIFPGEPYLFCYCADPFGNIVEIATHPHTETFSGHRDAY